MLSAIIVEPSNLDMGTIYMFTLYRIDFWSGSEIDPIQCEQFQEKSNWNGPDLSCSH